MTNFGFTKFCEENNIRFIPTKVGDRFVLEEMLLEDYRFGGEQSGHIIMKKYATTGDGILTAVMVMERIVDSKLTLSRLASPVVMYPQVTVNVPVSDREKIINHPAVRTAKAALEAKLGDSGRILLRKSGTEPVLRVMVEAPDESLARSMAEELAASITAVSAQESKG